MSTIQTQALREQGTPNQCVHTNCEPPTIRHTSGKPSHIYTSFIYMYFCRVRHISTTQTWSLREQGTPNQCTHTDCEPPTIRHTSGKPPHIYTSFIFMCSCRVRHISTIRTQSLREQGTPNLCFHTNCEPPTIRRTSRKPSHIYPYFIYILLLQRKKYKHPPYVVSSGAGDTQPA